MIGSNGLILPIGGVASGGFATHWATLSGLNTYFGWNSECEAVHLAEGF